MYPGPSNKTLAQLRDANFAAPLVIQEIMQTKPGRQDDYIRELERLYVPWSERTGKRWLGSFTTTFRYNEVIHYWALDGGWECFANHYPSWKDSPPRRDRHLDERGAGVARRLGGLDPAGPTARRHSSEADFETSPTIPSTRKSWQTRCRTTESCVTSIPCTTCRSGTPSRCPDSRTSGRCWRSTTAPSWRRKARCPPASVLANAQHRAARRSAVASAAISRGVRHGSVRRDPPRALPAVAAEVGCRPGRQDPHAGQ